MSESINERDKQETHDDVVTIEEANNISKDTAEVDAVSKEEETITENETQLESIAEGQKEKKKLTKKKKIVLSAIIVAVVAIAAVIAIMFIPSKFDKVKSECLHIAGTIGSGKGYFTIDTKPNSYDNMDPTLRAILLPAAQENALEAIKHANNELGFGYAYSQMLNTSALMGRQTEENDKYKVSWTYHPDEGLVVTYSKK